MDAHVLLRTALVFLGRGVDVLRIYGTAAETSERVNIREPAGAVRNIDRAFRSNMLYVGLRSDEWNEIFKKVGRFCIVSFHLRSSRGSVTSTATILTGSCELSNLCGHCYQTKNLTDS